ncbi:cytochrome P450 [Coprinopsis cinerea AmutBmut pab1-1]|nr:cytochrome P450 [Coprinopsis cinerea AmutBmut pab1-1]
MDAAPDDPEYQSSSDLTMRIISLNMAAIHTTSLTLNHCLFDLAARQEYLEPLRMEVEEIIGAHGWTKESMARMHKFDSFIKESSRTSGLTTLSMQRQTRVDFRLSNGVVIPKGFRVAVASAPLHNDPEIYPEPTTFKGFRFVEGSERDQLKGEGAVEDGLSRQTMVALSPSFLHFGAGRHACPGRFFAVNEVKAILAYILMTYDMKLPGKSTTPPAARWIADARVPDPNTEIFFRKRV